MKKRKVLFKILKRKLAIFVDSVYFIPLLIALFAIGGAIVGFNVSKVEPIPLTEDEVKYYTNQAETAYYEGLVHLDDDVVFKPQDDDSFYVYGFNQPEEKQQLIVTFSGKETPKVDFYYSYDFFNNRIVTATAFALFGAVLSILLIGLIEWISIKLAKIKDSIKKEIEKELSDLEDSNSEES